MRDITEDTELTALCVGIYERLQPYFRGVVAAHLRGKTEEGWEKAIESRIGPWQLVSGFFKEYELRRFLDGYVEPVGPQMNETPLKKGRECGESSSPAGDVPSLWADLLKCHLEPGSLVAAPEGFDWPCGLEKGKKLFVRDCYSFFFDAAIAAIDKKFGGCIFTGNPGIGKSVWLNYAVVRFLQSDRRVVLQRAGKIGYWLFSKSLCRRVKDELPDLDSKKWRDVVYLFDPDQKDSEPADAEAFTIVASSPQDKHYRTLQRSPKGVAKLYFPCWTLEELRVVAPEHHLDKPLEELWLFWGGIPRYIFSRNQPMWTAMLEGFVASMDFGLVEAYKGNPDIAERHQKQLSHMVVQYRVGSPFDIPVIDFASSEIGLRIIKVGIKTRYADLIAHYEHVRREQWKGPYAGHLWEHLSHAIIPLGQKGGFMLETLDDGNNRYVVKSKLKVVKGTLKDMALLKEEEYFQPHAANFPVIDAAMRHQNVVYGFQSTLSESHAPRAVLVSNLIKALPKGTQLHLVWVVDSGKNGGFGRQKFVDENEIAKEDRALLKKVMQWRLQLKFPKESPFAYFGDVNQ